MCKTTRAGGATYIICCIVALVSYGLVKDFFSDSTDINIC